MDGKTSAAFQTLGRLSAVAENAASPHSDKAAICRRLIEIMDEYDAVSFELADKIITSL